MDKNEIIFEEARAKIQELTREGKPFHGSVPDPDKQAQYELLCRHAGALQKSAFVQNAAVETPNGAHQSVHIAMTLPSPAILAGEHKAQFSAALNLADSVSFTPNADGSTRVTLTVLNYWKE